MSSFLLFSGPGDARLGFWLPGVDFRVFFRAKGSFWGTRFGKVFGYFWGSVFEVLFWKASGSRF